MSNQRIKELLQKIIINLWEQAVPPEEIAVETDMEFIRERIMKLIKEGGRTNNQAARETFEKWSGRLSPRQKKLANERLSASENFPFDSIEAGLAFFADLAKKISQTTSSQQNPSKRASKKKKSKKSGRKRK